MYSSGQNQIVMSIPCGGGHRAWDCSFSPHHHVAFYYIKSRSVCVCEAVLQDDQSILRVSCSYVKVTIVLKSKVCVYFFPGFVYREVCMAGR